MGYSDFQVCKTKIIGYTKNDKPIYELESLIKNVNFIKQYSNFILKDTIGEIINRPIFKYTQFKEDIIFIACELYSNENTNVGIYKFAVNEKSFWKRFNIVELTVEGPKTLYPDENNALIILENYRKDRSKYSIKLNIMDFEKESIKNYIKKLKKPELEAFDNLNLKHGSNVNFLDFQAYSKRLWLELFIKDDLRPNKDRLGLELGNPASSDVINTDCLYDITDKKNKKYDIFII